MNTRLITMLAVLLLTPSVHADNDLAKMRRSDPIDSQLRQLIALADANGDINYGRVKNRSSEYMNRAWAFSGRIALLQSFGADPKTTMTMVWVAVGDNPKQKVVASTPTPFPVKKGQLVDVAGFVLVGGRADRAGMPTVSAWFILPAVSGVWPRAAPWAGRRRRRARSCASRAKSRRRCRRDGSAG